MQLTGLNASLAGNFLFESSSTQTTISMTGLTSSVGVNGQGATLSNGTGILIINDSGVAGNVSGDMQVNAGPLESGGQIMIRINNTGSAVDESVKFNGSDTKLFFSEAESKIFAV